MAFQTTIRQKSLAVDVAAAAKTLAPATRASLEEKLAPYLREGEAMPDGGLLQELLGRFLEAQAGKLAEVDQAYNAEVREHRLLRLQQVQVMAQTRASLRMFREAVERIFGDDHCRLALGTRSFTTRDPGVLAGLARQAAQVLRQPGFIFDAETPNSLGRDSEAMAAALEQEASQLQQLTQEGLGQKRLRRRIELGHKDEALAATKEAVSEAAALLKGLFVFTGNRFLAKRLRPSHRKKGSGGGAATAKE